MKFAATALLFAILVLSGQPGSVLGNNDYCWNATQVTCGQTYFGSTTDLPIGGRASDSLLVGDCVDNYGGAPAATLYDGVWYKISTGADTFELTLDTCQNSNYDSALSLLSGAGCSEVNPDEMNCVGNNDDRYHNYNGGCALIAVIGPDSPSEDSDYWIYVHGYSFNPPGTVPGVGDFSLSITCNPIPPDTDPTPPIDPWFIQRSAYPPPEVTNADPLEGGTWLELHPARIATDGTVPELSATAYTIDPNAPNAPCDAGTPIPGVTFSAQACLPGTGTGTCPELMNFASVAVQQSFVMPNPYDVSPSIWTPPPASPPGLNGHFSFCVHTDLLLDFTGGSGLDEVSYIDTYYVVEVDYTSGFTVNVATFDRNPGNVEKLFDGFRVKPYVCDDGNGGGVRNSELFGSDYLVGENVRLCIAPQPEFENFQVVSFNDVTCTASDGQTTRDVIVAGDPDPLTTIDPSDSVILALETVVTEDFTDAGNNFTCSGTVEMAPLGARRMLQEEGEAEKIVTGSFKVEVTIAQKGLSTGAIVGIVVAAFAVFLVLLLVLYRRGCFDKKKNTNKPPKTVMVEESSETTGSDKGDDV